MVVKKLEVPGGASVKDVVVFKVNNSFVFITSCFTIAPHHTSAYQRRPHELRSVMRKFASL